MTEKALIVATVSTSEADIDESVSTVQFVDLARNGTTTEVPPSLAQKRRLSLEPKTGTQETQASIDAQKLKDLEKQS